MQYLRLAEILEDVELAEEIQGERMVFSGGENHIKLQSEVGQEVTIEACLTNSDYVMELFLATDALRRAGAKEISLVCPYIPYSRQDRVMVEGEPLSIKVFIDLLNTQRYKAVYTLNNHSPVTTALIRNCVEIDDSRILRQIINLDRPSLVSPDAGAYKKAMRLAKLFGMELVCASKVRDVSDGKITATKVDVETLVGKTCYIIDDICDGGRTFVELAKALKAKGCEIVVLYVSHGIFQHGLTELEEHIDRIYTTNCFRLAYETECWKKFEVIKLRKEDLK